MPVLLYMAMLACCIANFDILRNLKDALLVTRLGAEVIPFIKFWAVFPSAFVFLGIYSFLANRVSKRWLFILVLLPFLIWMPVFSHFLYPRLDQLSPNSFLQPVLNLLPHHLQFVSGLFHYWPLTVFYIVAELWGAAVICVLFWTTVNDASCSGSAAYQYPRLIMVGNMASLFSGPLVLFCVNKHQALGESGWQLSLETLSWIFTVLGVVFLMLFEVARWTQKDSSSADQPKESDSATSLPAIESLSYLLRSPHIVCIALIMLCYCITINLSEVIWKSQLAQFVSSQAEFSILLGKMTFLYGVGTLIMGLIAPYLLRRSWYAAALATPAVMAATILPFLLFTLWVGFQGELNTSDGTLLGWVVGTGMLSLVLCKSAKYTWFDQTKEISFIPLSDEEKYKGKAAIELVVSRAGKSGSALFLQSVIVFSGSISMAIPMVALILVIILGVWFFALHRLNLRYMLVASR
ncbi:MAG: Npt1/Npt2 family nucleotide transporter [Endozoicomonas sp.]|uniref:Npt1/Npt2 family nucleotide transporter n=1 Tax=Endozoicomonas sp. TaxID=1892382 RepID=UPI003D9BA10A